MTDHAALGVKLDQLIEQQRGMQMNISELTRAVSHLALIEERQTEARKTVDRLIETNTDLEKRVRGLEQQVPNALDLRLCTLEKAMPMHGLTSNWVMKAVWLVIAAVLGAVLKGAGA